MTSSTKTANHEARAQAVVRRRHLREKDKYLEERKSSLQETIAAARQELNRVDVALARNELTLRQSAKPRVALVASDDEIFEIPMGDDDVTARLMPAEVKAALRMGWQKRHAMALVPAPVLTAAPLIGPLPHPTNLRATVRPSSAEYKPVALTDTIADIGGICAAITATAPSRLQKPRPEILRSIRPPVPAYFDAAGDPAAFPPRRARRTGPVSLHQPALR